MYEYLDEFEELLDKVISKCTGKEVDLFIEMVKERLEEIE